MRLARNHTSQLVLSLSICTNEYPSTHVYRLVDNKYGIFPFTTYGHTKQFLESLNFLFLPASLQFLLASLLATFD